jgi:hypothetical protein
MFQMAFKAMYKARWHTLPQATRVSEKQTALEENRSMVSTILSDE